MKRGFTLIEAVLFMGLFTIFITVLTAIFVSVLDARLDSEAVSSVDQDGAIILNRTLYDIARASAITTPANLGETASSLVLTISGSNYTYAVSGNNLVLTTPTDSGPVNSYNTTITNVSFKKLGNVGGKQTVQINYTVTSTIAERSGYETRTFQTTSGLR